jgi:hypothetical protein
VVDGSPAPGTVLCLSHWPGIGSPPEFAADLSADMAFRYLGSFDRHGSARAVSNNHFDQDGLVGLFALVAPDVALARRDELVEVARAGDFAVTSSRNAARISMVLSAYADPQRSPLPALPDDYDDLTAALYTELLGRLGELCERPDRYRELWAEEDATLTESEDALASGAVTITEAPELDLAVVEVSERAPGKGGHRFGGQWVSGLHPMAVHNATDRGALLTLRGHHYELAYRYESWVQFRSRAVRPRVDLAPLAERLNAEESAAGGTALWVAQSVSALTPTLSPSGGGSGGGGGGSGGGGGGGGGESNLAAAAVVAAVRAHLGAAPPAWDPFHITR